MSQILEIHLNSVNKYTVSVTIDGVSQSSGELLFRIFSSSTSSTALFTARQQLADGNVITISPESSDTLSEKTYYYELDLILNNERYPLDSGNVNLKQRQSVGA